MLSLPACSASDALRARFPANIDAAIIEDWVADAIGDNPDRTRCFGPTAVNRARRNLQVTHHEDSRMLHDGELRFLDGRRKVFIPSGQYPPRTRFTLAHELGHVSLHDLYPALEQSGRDVERLCNLFAAELIMPMAVVRATWRETPDVDAVIALATRTSSSLSASCIRIAECMDDTTTGLMSANGLTAERYGWAIADNLDVDLVGACQAATRRKSTMNMQYGLTVSTRAVRKRVVFLAQKIR